MLIHRCDITTQFMPKKLHLINIHDVQFIQFDRHSVIQRAEN